MRRAFLSGTMLVVLMMVMVVMLMIVLMVMMMVTVLMIMMVVMSMAHFPLHLLIFGLVFGTATAIFTHENSPLFRACIRSLTQCYRLVHIP